jgi:hypothetical protein
MLRARLVVCLAVVLAGCASPLDEASVASTDDPFAQLRALIAPTGHEGYEPSIGITKDGSIFVLGGNELLRSRDAGASWEVVNDFHDWAGQRTTFGTSDPWLWVDPVTDRVFVAHNFPRLVCVFVAWSDDAGETFSPNVPACPTPVSDFHKLVTGPPGPEFNPEAGGAFERVVYMCYVKPVTVSDVLVRYGTSCSASYDGGATWKNEAHLGQSVVVAGQPSIGECPGGAGPLAVSPDGVVVLGDSTTCSFRSRDSGLTWDQLPVLPSDGMIQFGRDGLLYEVSILEEELRMHRSPDEGTTWEGPWSFPLPGIRSSAYPAMIAGDAGRIVVKFLGAEENADTDRELPATTRWHAWFVTSDNADAAEPTFTLHRATPDDAPLHVGCISRERPCLWMGDFAMMTEAPDGTPNAAFPDTCNEGCEGDPAAAPSDRPTQLTVVALPGWTLRAAG